MKANDIRDLTTAEIEQKVKSLKEELFNLRFQLATGQLENTARIREVRKSIARMKTVIREREMTTLLKKKSVELQSLLLTLSMKLLTVTMHTLTAQDTLTMLKT